MEEYLIETPNQEREHESIRRLLSLPEIARGIFESQGLLSGFSWYILQIQESRLVESFTGEIDILAGQLTWDDPQAFESLRGKWARKSPDSHPSWHEWFAALELAESDGIKWPPQLDCLVAIEAKCAYFELRENRVKAAKPSPKKNHHIHWQISGLLQMGFNRVLLLDLIANPPASGDEGQAWVTASNIACSSTEKMSHVFAKRLPEASPCGHYVLSWGAVLGGDERMRGVGYPLELRKAVENPLLQKSIVRSRRKEMEENLRVILGKMPKPRSFPEIIAR